MNRKWAWLLVVLWAPVVAGAGPQVHEYELDNGLKLLVKPDHRAPVVVSQVWYGVGSSYEPSGLTGISHVLEHMMFKGTEKHPAGEFSRIIAEAGGKENAFTGRDYTAYFQRLAADRLEVSFRLEADRMRNLLLPPEEFDKERKVVMEERRLRTEDDPQSLTYERFTAVSYLSSPYRNPVIGWMSDLRGLEVADLRQWYERWYAPNNAVVVVVGDVDPDQVRDLATQHFGQVPARAVGESRPTEEPPQRGLRRVSVEAPARVPYVVLGYKVPVLKHAEPAWEAYALEVLAGILDGGDSARLQRHLVRGEEVAASAGAGYDLYARLDSLLLLDGTPANGQGPGDIEQALRGEVAKLREALVSAEELKRVKTQVLADDVYEKDSMFYQAMRLGMLETVGLGWQRSEAYVKGVQAVTAEQVRAVARKYLTPQRLTVAILEPAPGDGAKPSAGSPARQPIVH